MNQSGISFNVAKKAESKVKSKESVPDISYDNEEGEKKRHIKKNRKLVVPLPSNNNQRLVDGQNGLSGVMGVSEKRQTPDSAEPSDLIRKLMKMADRDDATFKKDLDSLNDEDSEDYSEVAIEDFGLAMLRGMGWKDGDKSRVDSEKILLKPRTFGLPTDQKDELSDDDRNEKRKRKKDDQHDDDDDVINSGGAVSGGSRSRDKFKMKKGQWCAVIGGKYKGKSGKIMGFEDNNSWVIVKLLPSDDFITVRDYHVSIEDSLNDEVNSRRCAPIDRQECHEHHSNEHGHSKHNDKSHHKKTSKTHWLRNGIVVRIISRDFKEGRYYKQKAVIEDVTTPRTCTCRTDNNIMLEDLDEDMLETVIPREEGSHVMIVKGLYKGQIAIMLGRNKKDETVFVNLLDDNSKSLTLTFNDICQCAS
ncbi:hypothetical protein HELRODRAFT_168910 [Helobdella robusta]|uniref:KOW domain-containing protein n=1 Tax=Helobdella robusta TaxID=6412 RepID=T1F144_HELRO|nr:hypothetical protein HELRODRAFT_168910 [Helobdella robusta]ESO08982.1 hypothetical protein HELRODRAFT_168910 [Helobdella robusta]